MTTTPPLARLRDFDHAHVAEAAAEGLADSLAWTTGLGWLYWDGRSWRRSPSPGQVEARGVYVEWLKREVGAALPHLTGAQVNLLTRHLYVSHIKGTMELLAPLLAVPLDAWDSQPHLLATPTGVVDLRDGSVSPLDPGLRMTRITSAGYVKGKTHPDWERAVLCQPDVDTRLWLQASLGSGCWGRQRVDSLGLLTGNGANGKSTITGAVVEALGDYASEVDRSVIVGSGHEEHRAGLRGLRLALVEELEEGHRLNMAEVKGLLGTEEVVGRHLYQAPSVFRAQFTLMVTTNYKPQVPDTDHGTWRRLDRLDFGVKYEGADLDLGLRRRCKEDPDIQEAVLAWLVEGALMEVPEPTPVMVAAKEEWREEADSIAAFIRDHCHVDPEGWTTRAELYRAFCDYTDDQGLKRWTARTFTSRWLVHPYVEAMNLTDHKREGQRGWLGLRLEATVSDSGARGRDAHPF